MSPRYRPSSNRFPTAPVDVTRSARPAAGASPCDSARSSGGRRRWRPRRRLPPRSSPRTDCRVRRPGPTRPPSPPATRPLRRRPVRVRRRRLRDGRRRPPARPAPVPALPDVVVVVYARHGAARAGARAHRRGPAGPAGRAGSEAGPPAEHAAAVDGRPGRDRAAATSTRSTWSGTPPPPYTGDPLPGAGPAGRAARRPLRRRAAPATAGRIGCASPETLVEVRAGRVDHPADQGHPPGHRRRPPRAARLGQGTRRAHHDRRPGTQRPGPGRPAPARCSVDELFAVRRWCDLWQAESTVSAPLADGARPGRPAAGGLPRRLGHRRAEAGRAGPDRRAWNRSAAAPSMGALGWVGPDRARPRPDHPHRRRRRRPRCTCGPAAASPGTATPPPRSPRPPPRPPRSARLLAAG